MRDHASFLCAFLGKTQDICFIAGAKIGLQNRAIHLK